MAAIETRRERRYGRGMRSILLRLVTLVAVMLMPLGMAAAPAAAHHSTASAAMPHCPDRPASDHGKGGMAECTMMCSSALPAIDQAPAGPAIIARTPLAPSLVMLLRGILPDIATPPPKRS
jgi:hypothetical protein